MMGNYSPTETHSFYLGLKTEDDDRHAHQGCDRQAEEDRLGIVEAAKEIMKLSGIAH